MLFTSRAVIHLKDFIMLHSVIVENYRKSGLNFLTDSKMSSQADAGLWRNFLNCYLLLLHMSFTSMISLLSFITLMSELCNISTSLHSVFALTRPEYSAVN